MHINYTKLKQELKSWEFTDESIEYIFSSVMRSEEED